MELRYYQREAVDATYKFLGEYPGRNPCVVLPTGAGKTIVLAKFCQDIVSWGGRALVVAHVKELLDQSEKKLSATGLDVGVYSSSLNSRDSQNEVIVAGVQSIYQRGLELCGSRPFSVVIIDEAHRIPVSGNGMYVQLLESLRVANPKLRIIGLTATPYRTGEGYVCSDEHFLNEICYEAGIRELIAGGYLAKLISKRSKSEVDMSGVKISGDYQPDEMERRFNDGSVVSQAVRELLELTADRRKVLIFCCGIAHACSVAGMLEDADQSVRLVTSEHGGRDAAIEAFKLGSCKYLVNVNVLTEGFDATDIDAVVLLRATVSPGLYYQMVGRGLRVDERKQDCLVLDFGGNIQRHGPIDDLNIDKRGKGKLDGQAPVKACPECDLMVHAGLLICSGCGYEFPAREPNHEERADTAEVIGSFSTIETWTVGSVGYSVHEKKGMPQGSPRTLRVTYYDEGMKAICDEWVCLEHSGFAFEKARVWWFRRTTAKLPHNIEEAVSVGQRGGLAEPEKISVKRVSGKSWREIVDYELGQAVNIADVASEKELFGISVEEIPW